MALSKQKDSLFDPIRLEYVPASPEEIVRQNLLQQMTGRLGYPKQLLSVETRLSTLPHLDRSFNLPNRRADLICFAKGIHKDYPLYPLLLIECKEGDVGEEAKEQALGYNHYVGALFVAVAGKAKVRLVHPIEYEALPSYQELLERVLPCK